MSVHTQPLLVEGRPGGPLMTMTYWLTDQATGLWALVDPTYDAVEVWLDRLAESPKPSAIYITHGHFDHVAGLAALRRRYPDAPVWVHPEGRLMLEDAARNGSSWTGLPFEPSSATHEYRDGDVVRLGETELRVIDAPGHCPGSVVLFGGGQLLAGDVLFRGAVGRWDLPGASYDVLSASIRDKVMTLPDDTVVWPGHGPATTIGEERAENPIVQAMLAGRAY